MRRSWAAPLGWAGLQKVPPHEEDHLAVLEAHVTELAAELAKVDDAIATERVALWELAAQVRSLDGHADLTSSLAQRRAELAARERALLVTAGERAQLATEIEAHREHLARPVIEAPDAHLRRVVAGPPRPTVRRPRFLKVWAAVSTPLLVLTIVVLLTAPPLAFFTSVALFGGLFLGVEAAARGRLLSFLGGLLLTLLTIGAQG